jgi:hypothetical protein
MMRRSRPCAVLVATGTSLLALALTTWGCGPSYSYTAFSDVGGNQLPASVTATQISLLVGDVVTAQVAPYDSAGKELPGDVASEDATVLQVYHAIGDRKFAFLGVKAGTTRVDIIANGMPVGSVTATVSAQP